MTKNEIAKRAYVLSVSGGVCEVCSAPLNRNTWQGAHRIADTVSNRAKWGSFIIDSPLNIAAVCSLKCNDACNIGGDFGKCLALAEKIIRKEKIHRFNEVSES